MAMEKLLSTTEVAKELDITDSLVRRYIRDSVLPAQRFGVRSYAVSRKDLERFKQQRLRSNRRAS